jgi:DsbC/DsbD-like thiol-disulfide interchange protein
MIASLLFTAAALMNGPSPTAPWISGSSAETEPIAFPQEEKSAKSAPDGNRLVKVALAADRDSVHPGEKFTLAAKLTIEPGWHIYWQNPGDAGVPTRVDVKAPAGFKVGELQYPVPEREESAGDILSYVYKREVALLVDVEAPPDLAPGAKVELGIDCRWLVCTSLCVPGSGKASIELAAAASGAPARPANDKEFEAWRAKMPRPYEDLLAIAGYHDGGFKDWKKPFIVNVPGANALDFYPRVEEPISLNVMNLELQREENGCTMKLTFEPPAGYAKNRFVFSGVLAVSTAGGEKYYQLGFGYRTVQ